MSILKNTALIKKTIEDMGGYYTDIVSHRNYFMLHLDGKILPVARTFFLRSTLYIPRVTTSHKDITHALLAIASLPFPKTLTFWRGMNRQQLLAELSSLRLPLIIKPAAGSKSSGVVPFINSIESAISHLDKALASHTCVFIQEMARGKEYRVLMLDGKVIGALEMVPPFVDGDGSHATSELISRHAHPKARTITSDPLLPSILTFQQESLDSTPQKGKRVFLRLHSSLAEGGITLDVTGTVHPTVTKACGNAARITGYTLAGIDIICDDITRPIESQKFVILEVNSKPDIYIHHFPSQGSSQNVAHKIIRHLFDHVL